MSTLLTAALPALLPVVADGARGLFNKLTGGAGAKPATVAETVQLMQAETGRLEALARLDAVGNVSQWVANIRGLQRPVAGLLVLATYAGAVYTSQPAEVVDGLGAYAQMVVFYLFGDRTYMYLKRGQ